MYFSVGDIIIVREDLILPDGNKKYGKLFLVFDDQNLLDFDYTAFLLSSMMKKKSNTNIEITDDKATTGLHKDTLVKLDALFTFDDSLCANKIGSITQEQMDIIIDLFNDVLLNGRLQNRIKRA